MPVRAPTAILTVLGQSVVCEEVSISLSRDAKTDTIHARASLSAGPDAMFWSTANAMAVQCTVSDGAGGAAQLFDGFIDSVECDFEQLSVTVSGRDKSAKMLDKKSSKKHLNKKPHEIVQDYAGQSGISVDADSVSDKAGKTFQIDYVALIHRMSDFHAVQHLAELHGMTAYSTIGKLYFKKSPESLPTYTINYSRLASNIISLQCRRNVNLGKTIKSTVHSWNHKQQKKLDNTQTESGGGDTVEYVFHHAGLTQDQVQARAKSHLDKATRHEFDVSVEIPGDPSVNARMSLQLTGTNSAWDQLHDISKVEHKISFGGGYTTRIDTKAKSKKRGA